MKKIYMILTCLLLSGVASKAQDTLLFEDFELVRFYDTLLLDCNVLGTTPPGNTTDANWYSLDADAEDDASGSSRPLGWFASQAFSPADQYETIYGTIGAPDTNTVIAANSWTNTPVTQQNWLITKSIQLGAHDTLFWKSATRQTPRYLDGYEVRLSTTNNADGLVTFSNLLFSAAQMTALGTDSTYSTFTFAPTGASVFVHGQDGTFIDPATTTAPISHRGRLRPFSVPLDAYANQNVFIAFLGNSEDDNIISLDDVMIRGTLSTIGVNENKADIGLNLFPNPATDNVQVNYSLSSETNVTINIYDVTGQLISSESNGAQAQGRHFAHINTSSLAKGFYTVSVKTTFGTSTSKLIVK
jgi:Secretion system C-terminal sorting domain